MLRRHLPSRLLLTFSALLASAGAIVGPAATAQSVPPLAAELLEPPRIGIVFKGGAAEAKARVGWREDVLAHASAPEFVFLDALPASAAKAKTPPPRWIIVFEEAKAAPTGAATEEYEDDLGRSFRIRYRGATARARAKIHELRDKPVEIAELRDEIDDTKPPDKSIFRGGETKKEVTIDPEALLDRLLVRMTSRALALGTSIDLWRERTTLVERVASLAPDASAAFWRRAASVTLDPWYATTPVPWRSLETAALASWKRAPAAAARFPRPATTCAWCDLPAPAAEKSCSCHESRALAHALHVLAHTCDRKQNEGVRKSALAIEVKFAELDPSRSAKWKGPLGDLEKRMAAEHAADRALVEWRLGLDAKWAWGKQTYVILLVDEAVSWRPSEPDLERQAGELVQAFTIRSNTGGTYFGVDAARPTISLARWNTTTDWYEAVGRREFKGSAEMVEAMFVRALWDNARGVDSEPAPR